MPSSTHLQPRALLRLIGIAFLLALGACSLTREPRQDPPRTRQPNILFLFADDQRADAIEAFDNPYIRTPHIDSLVESGFSFRQNYCMGSIHGAVCQPSRAMLMSGRSLYRVPLDLAEVRTLPLALSEQGYRTFGTGKWHNGGASFLRSFQSGKNVMLGGMSNHMEVPVQDMLDDGTFSARRVGEKFSSELFADSVIEFLSAQAGSDVPFFAYAAFTAPHDPRQPPLKYRREYYDARPPLPANYMPMHPFNNGWMVGRDEVLGPWPRTPEVISDQLCEYYGMITHLDEQVGRILEALRQSGHAEDTIIVYTADHGLALGSHGLLGKQSVYEHSMGAPLIISGPGIPHGETRALTYLFDLYPTLCKLGDTRMDASVEGLDLSVLWNGNESKLRETLFLAYENKMRALRDERYKLLRYPLVNHVQLFDLQEDPDELHNLANEPEHLERLGAMWREMERWQQALDDPHPLVVPNPEPLEIDLTGRARKPDRWQPAWIVDKYFD